MYRCTEKNIKLLEDSLGKKFGRLTVIEDAGITAKGNRRLVNCICDCGTTKIVKLSLLRSGNTKSCGCFRKEVARFKTDAARAIMIDRGLWQDDVVIAAARKVWHERYDDGDIPFEIFLNLSQQNCFYCDKKPSNKKACRVKEQYFIYNGLDRVDNSQGHNVNNVVPCCYYCNVSKSDRTKEDFLTWIKIIFKRNFS
jgi:hypothetical protein